MSNKVYAITDLEGYAVEMRQAAANSLSSENEDSLDDYISISQMINLVKKECVGFDKDNRPLLNEDVNEKIYESTVTWIHNVGLSKLAAKDLLQCSWDDTINSMIFWANPEIGKSLKSPKGKSNVKRRNKKKDS